MYKPFLPEKFLRVWIPCNKNVPRQNPAVGNHLTGEKAPRLHDLLRLLLTAVTDTATTPTTAVNRLLTFFVAWPHIMRQRLELHHDALLLPRPRLSLTWGGVPKGEKGWWPSSEKGIMLPFGDSSLVVKASLLAPPAWWWWSPRPASYPCSY